ncbi:MAG: response regulator transcription factor [Mycobacteriales bacterium]
MRILAVDDHQVTREALDVYLGRHGYQVSTASSGAEALAALEVSPIDLVILDLGLPDMDGLAVCQEIRRLPRYTPVLMLTARDSVDDELAGFAAAADDYLRKPAPMPVLLARVRALERGILRTATTDVVRLSEDVELDLRSREVRRGGDTVRLGRRAFDLLTWFLEHPGRVWSKQQLIDYVWGGEAPPVYSTVEWHVSRIREALGDTGREPKFLITRPTHGYLFRLEPSHLARRQ